MPEPDPGALEFCAVELEMSAEVHEAAARAMGRPEDERMRLKAAAARCRAGAAALRRIAKGGAEIATKGTRGTKGEEDGGFHG